MPPPDEIEKFDESDKGDVIARSGDSLGEARAVGGKAIREIQGKNPDLCTSMTDIPCLGPIGSVGSSDGFCLTDGDQVVASKSVNQPIDDGHVIEYQPQQTDAHTFSLGLDYEETREPPVDARTVLEKAGDFLDAATKRAADFASDPTAQADYVHGLQEKIVGIGEGLNIAKEETKKAAAGAWNAVADGSVAEFLSKPNAINEPLLNAAGQALDAMAKDPNAVNHVLQAGGEALMKASDDYSKAGDREQGRIIGEVTFAGVNPEGSTEGAELALKGLKNAAHSAEEALLATVDSAGTRSLALDEAAAGAAEKRAVKSIDVPPEEGRPQDGPERPAEKKGDKLHPSETFQAELQKALESLDPEQRAFLAEHGVEVKPVRRISDAVPGKGDRTAGVYVPNEKTIYIAEEVVKFGRWQPNDDVPFMLRHEFGHALNANAHPFGDWISDQKGFIAAFKEDLAKLPEQTLHDLQLSTAFKSSAGARDEVFSDMYAHATGYQSNNPYSQLMKKSFPSCLKFLEEV